MKKGEALGKGIALRKGVSEALAKASKKRKFSVRKAGWSNMKESSCIVQCVLVMQACFGFYGCILNSVHKKLWEKGVPCKRVSPVKGPDVFNEASPEEKEKRWRKFKATCQGKLP